MIAICSFVSPNGVRCMLTESQHRLRGWHMAWANGTPTLKVVGDFMPASHNSESGV